jgi:hypothetical protein
MYLLNENLNFNKLFSVFKIYICHLSRTENPRYLTSTWLLYWHVSCTRLGEGANNQLSENGRIKMGNRIKTLIFMCLFIFLFMSVSCARRPIVLEDVYSKTNIDFNIYKRLAVIEFTPNIRVKKNKTITEIFEDEFQKQGYDVISANEVSSVLEDFGFSREDLLNPETLNKVSEKLHVKAVIRGEVQEYEVEKKDEYVPIFVSDALIDFGGRIYLCDIDLTIEMIEGQEGNKVWSCSISCSKKKGRPGRLIRSMIRNSLSTIPQE